MCTSDHDGECGFWKAKFNVGLHSKEQIHLLTLKFSLLVDPIIHLQMGDFQMRILWIFDFGL